MGPGPIGHVARAWERRPLSSQLVTLITSLLALGLVMSGTVMIGLLQRHLLSQIDEQLLNTASQLTSQGPVRLDNGETAIPSQFYLRLEMNGEKPIASYYPETIEASGTPIIPHLLQMGQRSDMVAGATTPITVQSTIAGNNWRTIAVPVYSSVTGTSVGVLTIALPLTDLQRTLRATALYVSVAALVIVVLGASMGHWLVRRSLLPLREIESTAGKIAAGDLTQRIPQTPVTTEVGSLSLSLNTMLSQVEQSFEARQDSERKIHRFVSDASHELRTPLAAISGYCELYAMGGIPKDRVDEVMGRIESESSRMATLVEDLLTLARLDEGRPLEIADIDLVKLADNAAFDIQALDSSRTVAIESLSGRKPPMTLIVPADRDRIQQVFTNIIGNIIRYTPKDTPVEIALGTFKGNAIVEFRDHGPGIKDADRTRVFERFYRADTSRARISGGSGLGLAIVSGILAAHHGSADLRKTKGGGLTVHIELPLTSPDGPAAASSSSPHITQ
ncbi:HAMP domain-containing sensor histidine kinase [Schaalia sp. ZJ1691]|uniref:sensor histidine kinase n=1 Tax=Schaalia sp. ZJ1691 TaxID=2709404 RepID=UPI0013EB1C40|nr:HAMP domain-containing sensor histidine kinase [Schaalia sp. ZJ1691]